MSKPHDSYELFEEIGRSDDTVVYRAHDLVLGRDVAIKELSAAARHDAARRSRFLNEAKYLAQHEHPGILHIHSVEPSRSWIVMELMQGTLAAQIQHSAMTAAAVRSILSQLLPALQFLHDSDRIHGAVRPSNILIDDRGNVKLSDFEQSNLGGELRAPVGGKKYLAPELIRSEFGAVGPVTDLYCLAFSALELLAGPKFEQLVFRSNHLSVDTEVAWLRFHSSAESVFSVQKLLPQIPGDLASTLDSMLIKSTQDRCPSAKHAIERLAEQEIIPIAAIVVDDSKPAPEPPTILPTAARELEPHFKTPGSTAPVASQSRAAGTATSSRSPKAVATKVAASGSKPAGSQRDQINAVLGKPYVLYPLCAMMLLAALWIGFQLQDSTDPLAVAPPPTQEETQEESQERSSMLAAEAIEQPTAEEPLSNSLAEVAAEPELASPEVDLATAVPPTTVDEELVVEVRVDREPSEPFMLPVESDFDIEPARVEPSINLTVSLPDEDGIAPEPRFAAFQPLELVSVEVDPQPMLNEYKGVAELVIDSGGFTSLISDVEISPDGRWVAACGDKVVRIWELDSGRLLQTLRGDRSRTSYGNCNAIAFSPDGRFLLVGVSDYRKHGSIRVYRTDNLDEMDGLLPGDQSPVGHLEFSRDGELLAGIDAEGQVTMWNWPQRKIVKRAAARNPDAPIYDCLVFPTAEPILAGIDIAGPVLFGMPELRVLTAADPLPPKLLGWMAELLRGQVAYPFDTENEPRRFDLHLEQGLWAAAGVGREQDRNKFWVGVFSARDFDAAGSNAPTTVYEGHRWNVSALALAPQHDLVASGDKFGELHVWSATTGTRLHRFAGQGKPVYEAALDRNSKRIAFGTKPFSPKDWSRNNYGNVEKILDLEKRVIYPVSDSERLDLIQEVSQAGSRRLQVANTTRDESSLTLQVLSGGQVTAGYELVSGRNPTVFSLLQQPVLGIESPVVLGDNDGLLAVWDTAGDELRRSFIGHQGLVSSISLSDKGLLLSGSADRTLRLWRFDDYQPTGIFDFKFENSQVTRLIPGSSSERAGVRVGDRIVSIDGRSMQAIFELMLEAKYDYRPGQVVPVVMSRDGQEYGFDMHMIDGYDFSEPVLNIFIGDRDEWIIWMPQGYYDASPGADRLIGWHLNRGPDKSAAFFEAQQFRKQLYRPDIINKVLDGRTPAQAIAEANSEHRVADEFDFRSPSDVALHHPPKIEFQSPQRGAEVRGKSTRLRASVESVNGLPISEVTLLVNGVADKVFQPDSSTGQTLEIDFEVQLTSGRNDLELIAANAESTSAARSIYVTAIEDVQPLRGNLNLLAIGISDYADTSDKFATLPKAASDATTFAQILAAQADGELYADVQSRVLTNGQATRTQILDSLQWLVDNTHHGDTAVVFVAAHGFVDSTDNFYIGTHEVELSRPRATAISWREFIKTLHEDLPSCKRLVFLDLQPNQAAIAPGQRNPLLDLAAPELGLTFFSSTSLQQIVPKSTSPGPGYLTEALANVLRDPQADTEPSPPDQLLNASEVSDSWKERIAQASRGRLYPIAFSPTASTKTPILQALTGE